MDIELKATLQLTEYEALLKTLGCPPGTLTRTLMMKATQDNERRLFREASMFVSKVREVGRLSELVELFETHHEFQKLLLHRNDMQEDMCCTDQAKIEEPSAEIVDTTAVEPTEATEPAAQLAVHVEEMVQMVSEDAVVSKTPETENVEEKAPIEENLN